ncbi:hypothetical protein D7D52_12305 [Nocardia yunnanensis]|uniref:Uncharacterized protein n=1 Tax=Nocardia yunnanensis TaxID=2382165 RepID=A0A386ZBH4_9NOCA|nr:NERD domain-containing protein [Nocardia yunnanensis]AYF74513.1 hypothetical protein D7D52_12305 [Nocardia yunnanensis]
MLVKVRNDDPSRLSSTERTVVNWLKSWSGPHAVPGIAVVQCQDADVVVWTPQTCVVVGVHGFTERVTGTLTCAQGQPWTVDGKPAPIDGDADPLERVRRQTVELAGQLRAAPGREQVPVSGLVLLVPQLGSRVKLEKGELPTGIDVLIGDGPSSLRAYFTKLAEGAPPSWDAAQVGQALGALGFAAAASYSDLVSEGFPVPDSARDAPLPFASRATEVLVPSVPTQQPGEPGGAVPQRGGEPRSGGPEGEGRPVATPERGGSGKGAGGVAKKAVPAATSAAAYAAVTGMTHPPGAGTQGRGNPPPPTPIPSRQPPPASGSGQPQPASPPGAGQSGPPPSGFASPQGGYPQQGATAQQPGFAPQPGTARQPAGAGQPAGQQGSYAGPQGGYAGQPGGYAPQQGGGYGPPQGGFPLWRGQRATGAVEQRRRRKDLPIMGALLLAVIVLVIAIACTATTTRTTDKHEQTHTSVVEATTTSHTTDPTIPSTSAAPACFPLAPCPG